MDRGDRSEDEALSDKPISSYWMYATDYRQCGRCGCFRPQRELRELVVVGEKGFVCIDREVCERLRKDGTRT